MGTTDLTPKPARGGGERGATERIVALDGLRGVAILLVMLFHTTIVADERIVEALLYRTLRNWGWCGVDLFFVLSGFLITGILWDAKGKRRYFRNFYARRTLRIFPVYYGFLAVFFVMAPLFTDLSSLVGGDGIYYWLYLQNFATARAGTWVHSGYLDLFWSLAIEEQFYLVWPFVVLALRRRSLMIACVAIFVCTGGLRIALYALTDVSTTTLYVMTPTRLDGLAVGAFLAAAMRGAGGGERLTLRARQVLVGSGACLLAIAWQQGGLFYYQLPLTATVGLSFVALFFGSILVLVLDASPRGRVARVLASRPLQTLGRYSYALYVFHASVQTIFAWTLTRYVLEPYAVESSASTALLAQAVLYVLVLGVSLALAAASWRFVEAPILRLRRFFPR